MAIRFPTGRLPLLSGDTLSPTHSPQNYVIEGLSATGDRYDVVIAAFLGCVEERANGKRTARTLFCSVV